MVDGGGATTSNALPAGRAIGEAPVRLWGMSSSERLQRTFVRAGFADSTADSVVVVSAEWVLDESVVRALGRRPETALIGADGALVAAHVADRDADDAAEAITSQVFERLPVGVVRVGADDLVPAYNAALRKRESPLLARLTTDNLPQIERRMFAGSYKGVTDLVTKYVWPPLALHVTRWCASAGLTPNQVTFASFLLVLGAFAAFWNGWFWLGLACAWPMTFLDTVDGKLARVTLTSSKIGNAFDHGIDLIHPPFWWWAWLVGVGASGWTIPEPGWVLAILFGGYILQRLQEGLFLALFKIEIHIWTPFDSFFRLITTRRNPNLLLLTAAMLVGRPDLGILAVAAWTIASVAVHAVRIAQALIASRRAPLTSWMQG